MSADERLLNIPQRRHFEVALSMLLDTLSELEVLATAAGAGNNFLVIYDDDLDAELKSALPAVLASLRAEIMELARVLDVEPIHRSRARLVRAMLTSEIVRLDDSYAARLKGYGAVAPRAAEVIDPHLDRIRADLTRLNSAVS